MDFEPFDAPFADVQWLGCRNLFWGERLIMDLFEYQQSRLAEETEIGGEKVPDVQQIGLTESSRIWRLTFERALAVRVKDESLRHLQANRKPEQDQRPSLPAVCCFSYQSAWISELLPNLGNLDPRLGELVPIHYVFALLDDFIEIVADDSPMIEQIDG